jgi:prepilin-type N-terminal cleavage/methylation domain-containing protein
VNTRLSVFLKQTRLAGAARKRAFTLVEILVVVALLSFIILGLMATFTQTQRAWRTSMTQSDVLEAGRMATDLVARDLVSLAPSFRAGVINFDTISDGAPFLQTFPTTPPPNSEVRTNLRERVFFATQHNKTWRLLGYRVATPESGMPDSVIGTLYRYETNITRLDASNPQWTAFHSDNPTNANTRLSPIIAGVVHFSIAAYDANGALLTTNRLMQLGLYSNGIPAHPLQFQNVLIRPGAVSTAPGWVFRSNAVPAYVDIELGILEARTAEQARAIPNPAVRQQYLEQRLGNVHLFRQRIPIRNVDPEAYE